jgi:HSP20 family protein
MWTKLSDIDRMFGAMNLLRANMDRLLPGLEKTFHTEYGWGGPDGYPRTNLYDTGSGFEIKAEVGGMAKEDINIKIQGNYLEISGVRTTASPDGYKAHRIEREQINFTRSLTLPKDVNPEKVEASLKNGILTLTFPKSETAKPKQITVN